MDKNRRYYPRMVLNGVNFILLYLMYFFFFFFIKNRYEE